LVVPWKRTVAVVEVAVGFSRTLQVQVLLLVLILKMRRMTAMTSLTSFRRPPHRLGSLLLT
jgi:hypothetical protein